MKYFKSLLLVLLSVQTAFAQSSHLTLSDTYPSATEKINIKYDTVGTVLGGKKDIAAYIYFLGDDSLTPADVAIKANGRLLTGHFTIPAGAKAFIVKLFSGDIIDDNNEKGYLYKVYSNKKPVAGAYAMEASVANGIAINIAKIKEDRSRAIALYEQEFAAYPESKKQFEIDYYKTLYISKKPEYKAMIDQKIEEWSKSNVELEMQAACSLMAASGMNERSVALNKSLISKFPYSLNSIIEVYSTAQNLTDSSFYALVKRFSLVKEARIYSDNLAAIKAGEQLKKDSIDNYKKYAAVVSDKSVLAPDLNAFAYDLAKSGKRLPYAEQLSKQSLAILQQQIDHPKPTQYRSPNRIKQIKQAEYDIYADTYAFILYKMGRVAEALTYEQSIYEHGNKDKPEITEHYLLILAANDKYAEILTVAKNAIITNKSTDAINAAIKTAYVKVHGNLNGFDDLTASMASAAKQNRESGMRQQMTNNPAPSFVLKDMEGNTISLQSLKGKIIIVDFWATWCGPCKRSFPGMQRSVNKYKDDANVKFLFIDTWETGDTYADAVKTFIADNKYSFQVLLDEKGDDGKQSKVVTQFGVTGIPTKFVIDKNGNIRFTHIGYNENFEQELDTMIDVLKSSEVDKASPKAIM
ncbi:Thiol-disulfide isomerase or thioredoxin [Mucilaginibacter pineti]|uniref:Thiol-disulfide isomerase or thioredoxin n=1 Tax=Mucilaginibacter pineti TaxID=1391627 RepID=A0A1G6XMJ7_9SPHI|nr:TlpA disulfide reductase family protein [Mucilaginibacter pineti]SDD78645.1 Thiol-disulfide isomerase or thioredoxin [Mucilaginibacter pineti]